MNYGLVLAGACALVTLVGACNKEKPTPEKPSTTSAAATTKKSADSAYQKASLAPKPGQNAKLLVDPGSPDSGDVSHAIAVLEPTKGNQAHGVVSFSAEENGVRVEANLTGLKPGKHAFHIHVYGDCSGDDGKTAGTHFNFMGSSLHPPKDIKRITGNLGELTAGKDGKATVSATIDHATLQGPYSIIGRAVIVHEKGNDAKSPPIGAAGGRVACGVIGIAPH